MKSTATETRHNRVLQLEETIKHDEKGAIMSAMKMLNSTYSDLLFAEDALKVFIVQERQIGAVYQTVYDLQAHLQEIEDAAEKLIQIAPVYQEYFTKKIAIVGQKADTVLDLLDTKFSEFTEN